MLAVRSWRRGRALVIAALLFVIPASAQVPVNLDEDTASAETAEPTDPTDLDSDLEKILVTGEKQSCISDRSRDSCYRGVGGGSTANSKNSW
jgi:hypothetical protein